MKHAVQTDVQRVRRSRARGFTLIELIVATGILVILTGLALPLASIGLYGLLSHMAPQRTRDIGVRIALGARQSQMLLGVMRQGLELVAWAWLPECSARGGRRATRIDPMGSSRHD